jgi:beta-glucosidase
MVRVGLVTDATRRGGVKVRLALLLGAIGALGALLALAHPTPARAARGHGVLPYLDKRRTPAERAADLVARMTTMEKASQMVSSQSPAIPRLGVHAYGWWNESLHGVSRLQLAPDATTSPLVNTMSYPSDLALGSSWDPALMYREATAISDEAREIVPGNALDLDFFAPTINLARDPRWGRNDETFSEDPLLTAAMGAQYVDGMEGMDARGRPLRQGGGYLKAIATLKHYAANDSEINRLTGSSDLDERTLREYDTAPFRQIIQEAHPGAVMSAFNDVNGVPSTANAHLLDTLARQTFGFGGYVTSDCDSIEGLVAYHHWRPRGWGRPVNQTEAHAIANASGTDLNCTVPNGDRLTNRNVLPAAVGEGIRTPSDSYNVGDLDSSLVRLFTARIELGEFDSIASEPWVKAARARVPAGTWTNSDANHAMTETPARLELARQVADRTLVLLKNAVTTRKDGSAGTLLPLQVPRSGPFRVAVIGSLANRSDMYLGGYSSIQGPAGVAHEVTPYEGIRRAIQAINPSATVDFYDGFTGGATAAGLVNISPAAVSAAANYDDVIVYAGTDRSTAAEDFDRTSLALPGAQAQLIADVAAVNPNTIAVMETIGQVDLDTFAGRVPAILWSSYNGERKGDALADVLLGKYDPSGHLPFTWYQSAAQLPPITDYRIRPGVGTAGRTYMYFRGPIEYPFGYGLSYTTFKLSKLRIDHPVAGANDTVHVSLDVTNTGSASGKDLVQLYLTPPRAAARIQPSIKRLEGFQQVPLAPGHTRTVTLTLRVGDLAFFSQAAGRNVLFDGRYGVQISSSALGRDVQLGGWLTVRGKPLPAPSVVSAKPTMPGDARRGIQSRVMFPQDTVVLPQLTVSMNDESLYGHIGPGRNRALPRAARVHYATDDPRVVAVARDGTIHTLAPGVATVTATVAYNGTRKSTQFVMRVVSELEQLKVDGKPLPGFNPDTYDYDVIVPVPPKKPKQPKRRNGKGAPKRPSTPTLPAVPRISVLAPKRPSRVRIAQAGTVPGVGQVTITGRDGIAFTYHVYFARPPTSDEFPSGAPGKQWTWIRSDPANVHPAPGSLVIAAEPGDIVDHTARNILVQPALGDWTIQSRLTVSVPPHAETQQAGIIAYQDDGDFLKLDWEFSAGAARISETTTDSLSGAPVTQTLATVPTAGLLTGTVWLRMVKHGRRFATYYSADGVHFIPLYSVGASLSDVQVGLFTSAGASTLGDMSVAFDYLRVASSGLTLGSNGSLTIR